MTATQLPKPGDRFRFGDCSDVCTVVAVTERNVFYERDEGSGYIRSTIPIPPKPHVEPVQWGHISPVTGKLVTGFASQVRMREYLEYSEGTLAKLDHGVLWLEVEGEWVRAFEDGES